MKYKVIADLTPFYDIWGGEKLIKQTNWFIFALISAKLHCIIHKNGMASIYKG